MPPLGQQIFDHAQAEWELEIQPNRVGDHVWGKAMAAIKGRATGFGHAGPSHINKGRALTLRCRKNRPGFAGG